MRNLTIILVLAVLAGCRSQKSVAGRSCSDEHHASVAVDSVERQITVDFDTVYVEIERPVETVRLKAVKGNISDRKVTQSLAAISSDEKKISEKAEESVADVTSSPLSRFFVILCLLVGFLTGITVIKLKNRIFRLFS